MSRFFLKFSTGVLLSTATLLFCGCQTKPHPVATMPEIYTPEPSKADYQIYLIIDDAGQHLSQTTRFIDLPVPLTIAVLPELPATRSSAAAIQQQSSRKQLMLHQPMQPLSPVSNPGPGAIYTDTPLEDIPKILRKNLDQVPGAKGMNNHMGSLITRNRSRMDAVMEFCKTNDLFFVDSLTTPESVAAQAAREHGVPTVRQQIFLDNVRNEEAITRQFEKGMRIAKETGSVVMIGHASSPATASVIEQMAQPAQNAGYSFHKIDDLLTKTTQLQH